MNNFKYYIFSILSITLFGCEKNIDFDGNKMHPKMVINSVISARSDTNLIKISESISDFSDQQPTIVENPEIQLYLNGVICNQIWLDTIIGIHTYYKFVSKLNIGDKVEISAYTPKHGIVKGHDIVPDTSVRIKAIEHSWFIKENKNYLRLHITLIDKPQEHNFYRIIVRTNGDIIHPSIQKPINNWDFNEIFTDDEMLFNEPTQTDKSGRTPYFYKIFDDELFQGKEYTLNLYIRADNFANAPYEYVRQRVKVEVQTLTEKLFRNLHSQELASGRIGDIFSEPVKIYSNMNGGYGILGIYNTVERTKLIVEKGE